MHSSAHSARARATRAFPAKARALSAVMRSLSGVGRPSSRSRMSGVRPAASALLCSSDSCSTRRWCCAYSGMALGEKLNHTAHTAVTC